LFAFPTVIQIPELLFIPCAVFSIFLVIYYNSFEPGVTLFLCLILAMFGIGAGNLFKKSVQEKNKRKAIAGIVVLLIPFLFFTNYGFGKPINSFFVNSKFKKYVKENYSTSSFKVDYPFYHWYDGIYLSKVFPDYKWYGNYYSSKMFPKNDESDYFELVYFDGKISDKYGELWDRTFRKLLTPVLEEEFGDSFVRVLVFVNGSEIEKGQRFDKHLPIFKTADIGLAVKDIEPATLAEEIIKCRSIIEQNDFDFTRYRFAFFIKDKCHVSINYLESKHINDELVLLIKEMQENRDARGYYSKNGVDYWGDER